jgi:hypothetical protein
MGEVINELNKLEKEQCYRYSKDLVKDKPIGKYEGMVTTDSGNFLLNFYNEHDVEYPRRQLLVTKLNKVFVKNRDNEINNVPANIKNIFFTKYDCPVSHEGIEMVEMVEKGGRKSRKSKSRKSRKSKSRKSRKSRNHTKKEKKRRMPFFV